MGPISDAASPSRFHLLASMREESEIEESVELERSLSTGKDNEDHSENQAGRTNHTQIRGSRKSPKKKQSARNKDIRPGTYQTSTKAS